MKFLLLLRTPQKPKKILNILSNFVMLPKPFEKRILKLPTEKKSSFSHWEVSMSWEPTAMKVLELIISSEVVRDAKEIQEHLDSSSRLKMTCLSYLGETSLTRY